MQIIPLAFDSLGVRSMATFIETDVKILIDPGVALGPKRYGLPPSSIEKDALDHYTTLVKEYALKADILIVSHYHFDHYFPDEAFWQEKIILVKDPSTTNRSQHKRGVAFLRKLVGDR